MQMRAIHKLESERGASLMVALLLFLVCTVVASIVLVAGTASAGRLSQLKEADQRYYSVTSAADLIKTRFPQTVEIARTHSYTQEVTTEFSSDPDDPLSNDGVPNDPKLTEAEVPYAFQPIAASDESGNSLTKSMGKTWGERIMSLYNPASANNTALEGLWGQTLSEVVPNNGLTLDTLTLTVDGNNSLTVTVEPTLRSDGSIILKLYNASGDEKYYLTMVLSAEVQEDEDQNESNVRSSITTSGTKINEVVTSNIVDKKTTTITWTVTDVLSGEVVV